MQMETYLVLFLFLFINSLYHFFLFKMYLFIREREHACMQVGEG